MHCDQSPSLLRADDHANDLLELGIAFAANRRAKVVSTAARLFVTVTVGEPVAAALADLGLDLVFGKWLSRLEDRAVAHLTEQSSAADVARALEPYFQHAADSARKTVAEPGNHARTTMAHTLLTTREPNLICKQLQGHSTSTLLRPKQHANALSELAEAFVSNRRAKVVSMAATLFVSAIVAEPFTPAAVNLGVDVVFGKWLSRLDDEAVGQLRGHAGPEAAARVLEPYFQQARDSASKTVDKPGDNPALTMAQHLETKRVPDEAIRTAASSETPSHDLPLPEVDTAHAPSAPDAALRASASVARERLRRQMSRA